MKKFLIAAAVSSTALLSTQAIAQDNTVRYGNSYIRADFGVVVPNDLSLSASESAKGVTVTADADFTFDTGVTISGAIGQELSKFLAIEGELGYGSFDYDSVNGTFTATSGSSSLSVAGTETIDGSIDTLTFMANAIITPFGRQGMTPYFGGGVGIVNFDQQINSIGTLQVDTESTATNFIGSGILGLDMQLSEGFDVGAKYRFLWADTGDNGYDSLTSHTFTAGVNIAF